MSNTLSFSSELMTNFLPAQVMGTGDVFEAVQTAEGFGILFSISGGVMYATQETPYSPAQAAGTTNGWIQNDISTAQIAADFPGGGAVCTSLCTAQNITDGTIGVAMVVSYQGNSNLYLSLGNSNSDTSWLSAPSWTQYPFDYPKPPYPQTNVNIVNVFISETLGYNTLSNGQYIVVDIIENSPGDSNMIDRYSIDTTKAAGYAWVRKPMPVNLDAGSYQSCIGRNGGGTVDVVYSAGAIGNSAQMVYTPLLNPFGPGQPPSPDLYLPGNLVPDAIATCRNADTSTDFYVASQGSLYYFASANQTNGAYGVAILTNPVFYSVTELYVYADTANVYVIGLNKAGQMIYCDFTIDQSSGAAPLATQIVSSPAQWSMPVPVLSNVTAMSPFVNYNSNGNTVYTQSEGNLFIMTRSPLTTLWSISQIMLPLPASGTSTQVDSYTTSILQVDANGQPVLPSTSNPCNVYIKVAAGSAPFYINYLYTVLTTEPVAIVPDNNGTVTLFESTTGLQGTQFMVSLDNVNYQTINSMANAQNMLNSLTTASGIQSATFYAAPSSTTPQALAPNAGANAQIAAAGFQGLYNASQPPPANAAGRYKRLPIEQEVWKSSNPAVAFGLGTEIESFFGDLYNWLKSGVEALVSIAKNTCR